MDVNYNDKLQTRPYDPLKWNNADANEVKNAINSKIDQQELADEIQARTDADLAISNTVNDQLAGFEADLIGERQARESNEADINAELDLKASKSELNTAISTVNDAVSTESGARITAINAVKSDLADVKEEIETIFGGNFGDIEDKLADLTVEIEGKASVTSVSNEVSARITAITGEESARKASDEAIINTISGKANQSALDAEILARTNGFNALSASLEGKAGQSMIDAEATARASADTLLSTAINSEKTARLTAEEALNSAISTKANVADLTVEVNARSQADTLLNTAISNEKLARETADTTLSNRIDLLGNASDLNNEIQARITGDATLQTAINAKASNIDLNTEKLARESADTAIATVINTKVDKVDGKVLSTNDYSTDEKNKLALQSGSNSGDETTATIRTKLGVASVNSDGYVTSADYEKFNNPPQSETTSSIKQKLGEATALTDGYLASEDFVTFNNKANKVNGVVPLFELPPVYISAGSGTGTQTDPYVFTSGEGGLSTAQLVAYFQSLPNWAPDRILLGDLTWIDVPSGGADLEKLATPTLSFGTPQGDSVQVNWTTVANGTTYTLQRDISDTFANAVTVYSGSLSTYLNVGLTPVTKYYYRLRATATGFSGSNYALANVTTDVQGNVTPVAPTLTANDSANTLTASHALGTSEILMSVNDGTYVAYSAISVGNVARAAGYWKFKIRSATGRNESPVALSPAFTETTIQNGTPVTSFQYIVGFDDDGAGNLTRNDENGATGALTWAVNEGESGFVSQTYTQPWNIAGEGASGVLSVGVGIDPHYGGNDALVFVFVQTGGQIVYKKSGTSTVYSPMGTALAGCILRLRADATTAYVEYSNNGGVTFTVLTSIARPSGILRSKISCAGNQYKAVEFRQYNG